MIKNIYNGWREDVSDFGNYVFPAAFATGLIPKYPLARHCQSISRFISWGESFRWTTLWPQKRLGERGLRYRDGFRRLRETTSLEYVREVSSGLAKIEVTTLSRHIGNPSPSVGCLINQVSWSYHSEHDDHSVPPPSSLRPHAVGEVRQSGWLEGLRILRHCKGFGHLPPVRILDPSELYNQSAHVRITRSPYSRPPIRLSGSMEKCIKLCGPSWYLNAKYDLLKTW